MSVTLQGRPKITHIPCYIWTGNAYETVPCEEFVPAYFVLRARKLEGCYPIITLSGSWGSYLLCDVLKYSLHLLGIILESHE
jgi:hypothetical protein